MVQIGVKDPVVSNYSSPRPVPIDPHHTYSYENLIFLSYLDQYTTRTTTVHTQNTFVTSNGLFFVTWNFLTDQQTYFGWCINFIKISSKLIMVKICIKKKMHAFYLFQVNEKNLFFSTKSVNFTSFRSIPGKCTFSKKI